MDNEFLLQDRLQKIRQIIRKYGEENFYLSYSGGKDSTVLSALIDMALPDNKIPRVYANTGIEYRLILDFVERERERPHKWELVILRPTTPIKPTLEKYGYPFKSKKHSKVLDYYQRFGMESKATRVYLGLELPKSNKQVHSQNLCPNVLKYQFSPDFKLKVSHKCCVEMKEKPLDKWAKDNGKKYKILGIMASEKGARAYSKCLAFRRDDLNAFQPLVPLTPEWENWFIDKYNVEISEIYKPPYNFERTGCKGCPFARELQKELDTLERLFPNEEKQCEIIWQPVYEEYRRLGYRLRKGGKQVTIDDYLWDLEHDEQRES